jgi:hypothetical protein
MMSARWHHLAGVAAGLALCACTMSTRNKGAISIFAVEPVFKPVTTALFSVNELDTDKFKTTLSANQRKIDNLVLSQHGGSGDDMDEASLAAALNQILYKEDLFRIAEEDGGLNFPDRLPNHVHGSWNKLKAGSTVDAGALLSLNRAILQALYANETRDSRRHAFAGGFLRGAFGVVKGEQYQEYNAIQIGQGYRFAFDNIHVRFTDETGGAEFLVYVEMYRGADLKPFYTQVIAHETAMPRNTDLIRKTVMTPPFTYEKDEPLLLKIVGIEIDSKEEAEAGSRLRELDRVAQQFAAHIPAAGIAPALTKLAETLYDLAKDGDDIEFQYAVAFYPQSSSQVVVRKALGGEWGPYLVELPLVAGQFALIKEENRLRRVPLTEWHEYAVIPVTRLLPSLVWLGAAAVTEPLIYVPFREDHLRDHWRFPGIIDEPVEKESYRAINRYSDTLAVYNNELRQAAELPELLETVEARPRKPYREKTYVLFSVLKTDEGSRLPDEIELRKQMEYLAENGLPAGGKSATTAQVDATERLVERLTAYVEFQKLLAQIDGLERDDARRLKVLIERLKTAAGASESLILGHLNRLTRSADPKGRYLEKIVNWNDENPPYRWDSKLNRWVERK